jgi:hypothetical protein
MSMLELIRAKEQKVTPLHSLSKYCEWILESIQNPP